MTVDKTTQEHLISTLNKFLGNVDVNTYHTILVGRNLNQLKIMDIINNIFNDDQKVEIYFGQRVGYVQSARFVHLLGIDVYPEDNSQIQICHSAANYIEQIDNSKNPRIITGKPARLIKRVYPFLSESQCNAFDIAWKEAFVIDTSKFEVKSGNDMDSFAIAYSGKRFKENQFNYSTNHGLSVKSLACSCMHGTFSGLGKGNTSPAIAYASGDFKVYWIEVEDKIAARVVVRDFGDGRINCGPIYTNLGQASDLLDKVLSEEYTNLDHGSWSGARLLKIEARGEENSFVCPFLDNVGAVIDDGDYLVIDSNDDNCITTSTSGYVSFPVLINCDCCEDGYSENDMVFIHGEGQVCYSCLNKYFQREYFDSEYYRTELLYPVMSCNSYESFTVFLVQDSVKEHCVSVEGSEELFLDSVIVEIDGKRYAKSEEFGLIFRDYNKVWHLIEERIETNLGAMSYLELSSLPHGCEVFDMVTSFEIRPIHGFMRLANGSYMDKLERDSLRECLAAQYEEINRYNKDGSTNWANVDLRNSIQRKYSDLQ